MEESKITDVLRDNKIESDREFRRTGAKQKKSSDNNKNKERGDT